MSEPTESVRDGVEPTAIEQIQIEQTEEARLVEPSADYPVQPADEAASAADAAAAEETAAAEGATPAPPPRVFISHKRDEAGINDEIAMRLKADLEPHCESVYLDLEMLPSAEFVRVIEEELSNSDFVIALISEAGNRSKWIRTELEYADSYFRTKGSPRIIPVRLGYDGLYDPKLNVILSDLHAISFDPVNDQYQYDKLLLRPIKEALEKPPGDEIGIERAEDRLSGFVVHESRRQRFRAAFLEPSTLAGIRAELRDRKLLWITGDAGVRNYLGLSLAIDLGTTEGRERIYEISRPRSWSQINSTVVGNAVIVFQDSTPGVFFEDTPAKAELDSLRSLVKRGNRVIVTASEDDFLEVEQEFGKEEFEYCVRYRVSADSFRPQEKITMFCKLLDLSLQTNALPPKHYNWVLKTLEEPPASEPRHRLKVENRDKLLEILKKCTPADIDQFFTQDLRQVRQGSDFITLLQQNAGGDEEVHAWFLGLDDSTRCFVLAIALCSELDRRVFWDNYKSIVQELRAFDQHLALLPIGVGRDRARPFVTTEGPLDFTPRVADVIRNEIAGNYREYFVELLPKLKQWSVPEGREHGHADRNSEKRKREVNETQALRITVARLIGTAAKQELDKDIVDILKHWGTDPNLKIRDAVAISLEQCAQDISAANCALDLLKKWGSGSANDESSVFKLYATALPLTKFALSNSGEAVSLRALLYLRFLARDRRHSVRFYTSIAVKKMARKARFVDLVSLLEALAQDDDLKTRVNVAQALSEAKVHNEAAVAELIQRWRDSTDDNLRWVAYCSVLAFNKQSKVRGIEDGLIREIQTLLTEDAHTVADVYLQLMSDQRLKKNAWRQFKQLTMEPSNGFRHLVISGLARTDFNRLDKVVLERLRQFGAPQYERLILEIRKAYWLRLITDSASLLADLRKRLLEKDRDVELFQTLTEMLSPEPEGCQRSFIDALIAFYPQDRELLNEALLRLESMAPSVFEPISIEVRRAAFSKWLYDPTALVQVVLSDLNNPQISQSTCLALERLAQTEPLGDRNALLQALAFAYALDPVTLRQLLVLLRNSGSQVLSILSYEFTYRLLEGKLNTPSDFVVTVTDSLRDEAQVPELLAVLERFAMSEPHGKRRALVNSLTQAKAADPTTVDALLRNPLIQSRARLARLQFEVRVASILESVFVPRFFSKWFRPKNV